MKCTTECKTIYAGRQAYWGISVCYICITWTIIMQMIAFTHF